ASASMRTATSVRRSSQRAASVCGTCGSDRAAPITRNCSCSGIRAGRRRTSRSSAASTCATAAATTQRTQATRNASPWPPCTATVRPGTTCSSPCAVPRSATSRHPSGNAGRTIQRLPATPSIGLSTSDVVRTTPPGCVRTRTWRYRDAQCCGPARSTERSTTPRGARCRCAPATGTSGSEAPPGFGDRRKRESRGVANTSTYAQRARRAERSPAMAGVARLGLTARAAVYLLIGWLAVQIALRHRSQEAHQRGAVAELPPQTYGVVLLWLLGLGLAAYAVWRLSQAAFGTPAEGRKKGPRLRCLCQGSVYAAVAATTFGFIAGTSRQSQSQQQASMTARAMRH